MQVSKRLDKRRLAKQSDTDTPHRNQTLLKLL